MKLAIRYYADPKIASLPDEASELMFVRGLARAGEEGREGFIPESALPELARRRRYAACVDVLVAACLWSRVDGGYQITRWADWQDGLDTLARRRAADRERQRRRRAAANQSMSRDIEWLSRDGSRVSRDASRDVTPAESESESDEFSLSSSRGNSRGDTETRSDDDELSTVPDDTWRHYAELMLKRQTKVNNPPPWKAKTAANAKAELAETALRWWREYDLTPYRLAQALVAGQPPTANRRETS